MKRNLSLEILSSPLKSADKPCQISQCSCWSYLEIELAWRSISSKNKHLYFKCEECGKTNQTSQVVFAHIKLTCFTSHLHSHLQTVYHRLPEPQIKLRNGYSLYTLKCEGCLQDCGCQEDRLYIIFWFKCKTNIWFTFNCFTVS